MCKIKRKIYWRYRIICSVIQWRGHGRCRQHQAKLSYQVWRVTASATTHSETHRNAAHYQRLGPEGDSRCRNSHGLHFSRAGTPPVPPISTNWQQQCLHSGERGHWHCWSSHAPSPAGEARSASGRWSASGAAVIRERIDLHDAMQSRIERRWEARVGDLVG